MCSKYLRQGGIKQNCWPASYPFTHIQIVSEGWFTNFSNHLITDVPHPSTLPRSRIHDCIPLQSRLPTKSIRSNRRDHHLSSLRSKDDKIGWDGTGSSGDVNKHLADSSGVGHKDAHSLHDHDAKRVKKAYKIHHTAAVLWPR